MADSVNGCCVLNWNTGLIFVLASLSCVHTQTCSEPAGVANAEILTSSPYSHGDLVTYRCHSGFTMSGSPSQLCSSGSWSGTAPTCTFISRADLHEQNVEFTNDSGDSMMYGLIILIGAIFILMLALLIAAICIICRRIRSRSPPARKPKKVKIKQHQQPPSPTTSARTPRMVDLVEQMMEDRRSSHPPAKELSGWRPFSKPVRDNNTSTQ